MQERVFDTYLQTPQRRIAVFTQTLIHTSILPTERAQPHPLVVLTAPQNISPEEYQCFYDDLCRVVMNLH